jgi:hypothetical protein
VRRHVLVGRFGPDDSIGVPTAVDEVTTQLDLAPSGEDFDYGLGHTLDDIKSLGVYPSEVGFDLLVLASLVHAADTRIARATESQDSWTREIRLVVPVSAPDRWISVEPVIKRMLDFLTGDRWTLGFRSRPDSFTETLPVRPPEVDAPSYDTVSLFSGGLDSLIGAIDLIENGSTPLLISHAGDSATSAAQSACFDALKAHYMDRRFARLRMWMSFPADLVKGAGGEDTTRGRSFLFFAIGAFAGSGLNGSFTLLVPENGLIALNVPLDVLRLGSLSTRTTHPFYMARWNELLSGLGINGRVQNPYWDKTKGEMAAGCANAPLLKQLVPTSLSCSSPSKARWQGRSVEHCGYCLPCLIRRAALEHALGQGNDPTPYTVSDLKERALDTTQAEGQQVRSFQLAIDRLRKRPDLAKLLIHKPGPLSDEPSHLPALADVYRRGMEEVGRLIAGVETRPH